MSQTLQWRVDRVKTYARKLHATLTLPEQMLRLNVHLSRNDIYKRYLPQKEFLFRKPISIADGAYLPADYVRYADNSTYTTGGHTYPFEYIPAEKIASVGASAIFKAFADCPKFAIIDQKVVTFPSGITIDNWEYYWHPVDLFASDNSIPGTTQDNMPPETEFAIVRGAFERSLRMQMGREAMQEFMEKNRAEVARATTEFYTEEFEETRELPGQNI